MINGRASALGARHAAAAVASAALYVLAMPPWDCTHVAWFALVPLFCGLRGLSAGPAALVGLAWGALAIWGIGWWVPAALAHYFAQPLWFGVMFALIAGVLVQGVYGAGLCASLSGIGDGIPPAWRPIAVAALGVAWELARSWPWTSNPWLLFGYALVPSPVYAQVADLGGVYSISFLLYAVNAGIAGALTMAADAWRRSDDEARTIRATVAVLRPLVAPAFLLVFAGAYGTARAMTPIADTPGIEVAIVQADVDVSTSWSEDMRGAGLDRYLEMSRSVVESRRVDLLVWPESALTLFIADEPAFARAIARQLAASRSDLITGGPFTEADAASSPGATRAVPEPRYYNSAFHLTADGIRGRYDKVRLLPFGEYFPLPAIELLQRRFDRLRSFVPGIAVEPLETRFGRVAVAICFEAIFPDLVREQVRRGAVLIVNLSNDAWLGGGPGALQHLAMARLRAIENRTWLVRAATTGVSVIVDPLGRVVASVPLNAAGTAVARVVPASTSGARSLYVSIGDLFAWSCVAIGVLVLTFSRRRSVRTVLRL